MDQEVDFALGNVPEIDESLFGPDISARQPAKEPCKVHCESSESVLSTQMLASTTTSYPSNPPDNPTFAAQTYPTWPPEQQPSYPMYQPYPSNQPIGPSHEPSHLLNPSFYPSGEPFRHSYLSNQQSSPLRPPPFSFSQSAYQTSYSRSPPSYMSYQPSFPSYPRSLSPYGSNQPPSCTSNPPSYPTNDLYNNNPSNATNEPFNFRRAASIDTQQTMILSMPTYQSFNSVFIQQSPGEVETKRKYL